MLKASQTQLVQQTNQAVLAIRQAQLNYFTSFHITFGGQAALIGGFVYSGLTQISMHPDLPYSTPILLLLEAIFWISSTVCMASALHCIFTTILLQVLGPGLALQGPVGSVSRATSGLNAETNQVIFAYFIMSISFAFSTMASFWLVMDAIGAILCSSLFCFSCYFWVKYCVRIYNRFKFDPFTNNQIFEDDEDNRTSSDGRFRLSENNSFFNIGKNEPFNKISTFGSGRNDSKSVERNKNRKEDKQKKTFFSQFYSPSNNKRKDINKLSALQVDLISRSQASIDYQLDGIAMEGYIGLKDLQHVDDSNSSSKLQAAKASLIKRSSKIEYKYYFFVLSQRGNLFYYKSKKEYRETGISINERTIYIKDYTLVKNLIESDTNKLELELHAISNDDMRNWNFRFDTKEDEELWCVEFSRFCRI